MNVRSGPRLSPDGKLALVTTGSYQAKNLGLFCVEVDSGKELWRTDHNFSNAYNQTLSADGRTILFTHPKAALVEALTSKVLARFNTPRECQHAQLLPDHRVVTSSSGGLITLWDNDTSVVPYKEAILNTQQLADHNMCLLALPNSNQVFVASRDGTARLLDMNPSSNEVDVFNCGQLHLFPAFTRGKLNAKFSPDGKLVCEFGQGQPARYGPRGEQPPPHTIPTPGIFLAQFAADGRHLLTAWPGFIQIRDTVTHQPTTEPITVPPDAIISMSRDAGRVAVSSRGTLEVSVFERGKKILQCDYARTAEVTLNKAVLSHDRHYLVTGDFAYAGKVEV